MSRENSTTVGVRDAWDFYLSQHDVSVPELIESAIEGAVTRWLDVNEQLVTAAIAQAVTDHQSEKAPAPEPPAGGTEHQGEVDVQH